MLALNECGHEFCAECWCTHFEAVLSSAGSTAAFECMQTKCKTIADKDFVLRCLSFSNVENNIVGSAYKYRVLLATDLIKESDDLQICPGEKEESPSTSTQSYTGTPQMTPRIGATTAPSNIRLVSTITSTPTISFSYIRGTPKVSGSIGSAVSASAMPSTPPQSSHSTSSMSTISTPTSSNTLNIQSEPIFLSIFSLSF